jgi:RNA polymerase sigma factor (sigma-70 family)
LYPHNLWYRNSKLVKALALLGEREPRKAELVKLRFFAGLTMAQVAAALEISESTADADWAYAKSWLRLRLEQ